MPADVASRRSEQEWLVPMLGNALPPVRVAVVIAFMLVRPGNTILVGPVAGPLGARRHRPKSQASELMPVPVDRDRVWIRR
jgi:hypothetical protein